MELGREDVDRDERGDEGDDCGGSRREAEPGRRLPPDAKQHARREQPRRADEQRRPGPPVASSSTSYQPASATTTSEATSEAAASPFACRRGATTVPVKATSAATALRARCPASASSDTAKTPNATTPSAAAPASSVSTTRARRSSNAARNEARNPSTPTSPVARYACGASRPAAVAAAATASVGMAVEASTDVWNSSPTGSVTASRWPVASPRYPSAASCRRASPNRYARSESSAASAAQASVSPSPETRFPTATAAERQRGRAEDEREIGLRLAQHEPCDPERQRGDRETDAPIGAGGQECLAREKHEADVRENDRPGQPRQGSLAPGHLPRAGGGERHEGQSGDDGERRRVRGRRLRRDEPGSLRADDGEHDGEQELPAARDGDDGRRGEDDDAERDGGRADPAVERLESGRQRSPDETQRRDELRAPGERHGDGEPGDRRGDRERGRSGHEVIQRRGRRQRRVAAGDARPDGREARCDLAVPSMEEDACGEDQRRKEGARGDALLRPIQPRSAASTKSSVIPSAVTAPPATASPAHRGGRSGRAARRGRFGERPARRHDRRCGGGGSGHGLRLLDDPAAAGASGCGRRAGFTSSGLELAVHAAECSSKRSIARRRRHRLAPLL